jgi:hypothetical protein
MIELYQIANEIRILLDKRREELNLYFIEDNHKYFMNNLEGTSKSNWPSVSKVLKSFYPPFPTQEASLKKAKGDVVLQKKLIKEWSQMADYANNTGSRVHYFLEKKIIERFKLDKEVREPEFDCDFEQIITSDHMISYGVDFYEKMIRNGAVLIDTEVVMGDPELGYTGQADKIWLVCNKEKTQLGIVVTDWKTNKPKNFVETKWTIPMNEPYTDLPNTALGHYYVQLSLYSKLFKQMLKGSKYEDIKIVRSTLVLLKDSCYEEYKTPIDVINRTLDLDVTSYLN